MIMLLMDICSAHNQLILLSSRGCVRIYVKNHAVKRALLLVEEG